MIIECRKCAGSGLYVGFCERDGFAVVCRNCSGSGCEKFEVTPFIARKEKQGIMRVVEKNPGVTMGGPDFDAFGGMLYSDWLAGKPLPKQSEMRDQDCKEECWARFDKENE